MPNDSRVVVVTGASAGVGRAIAHEFGRHGAKVALIARGREALEQVKFEIEQLGGEAFVAVADVSSWDKVLQASQDILAQWGHIDVWVNNAMVSVFAPVAETTAEEYRRVTEVTYLGYVHGTLAALQHMRARSQGAIIQIGSALAYRSIPLQSAYCAAKHAILGFTESLRVELLHDKSPITVTMVELPAVNTPQFRWVRSKLPNKPQPVPPIFQPEVVARAVYWVSHERLRELNVAFPAWKAIFAEKIAPSVADRYLATNGYRAQQTDELAPPHRDDNLYHPLPRLATTHGDFDSRSRTKSVWFWLIRMRHRLLRSVALE